MKWQQVKGWAGTHGVRSLVSYPLSVEDCIESIEYAMEKSLTIIPVGSGYTFGDMILNQDNMVLNTTGMKRIISWDKSSGIIIVEPGVKVADILLRCLPNNWVLSSIPGGLEITIGGAVSNNVHGKDSWKVGNFGDRVIKMKLLTSSRDIISIERSKNTDLFNAVVGGMGLIGIIVEITLQLEKIPSAFVQYSNISTKNIKESLEVLEESKKENDFSIAWIDAFSKNLALGRGYVSIAKWIKNNEKIDSKRLSESLRMSKKIFDIFPAKPTWRLLRPFYNSINFKILNSLIYHRKKLKNQGLGKREILLFPEYYFMHNKIPNNNHVHRPHGFIEFQYLFPRDNGLHAITECLSICQKFSYEPLVCAVKMHSLDDYFISFSEDGYSFNIDIPLNRDSYSTDKFVDILLNLTKKYNAKLHLAKDERLTHKMFKTMYPRHKDFIKIKNKMDPHGLYSSDLYQRLFKLS